MGQLPDGATTLIGSVDEVEALDFPADAPLAYVTQTTLSVDDTREIVAALKRRFPAIHAPPLEDICYATTNRQEAVKRAAAEVEAVIVVGAANSSNSQRLREVAERAGCALAVLAPNAAAIDWPRFAGVRSLAVTAGASAPEILVEEILDAFAERFDIAVETLTTARRIDVLPPAAGAERGVRGGDRTRPCTPGVMAGLDPAIQAATGVAQRLGRPSQHGLATDRARPYSREAVTDPKAGREASRGRYRGALLTRRSARRRGDDQRHAEPFAPRSGVRGTAATTRPGRTAPRPAPACAPAPRR